MAADPPSSIQPRTGHVALPGVVALLAALGYVVIQLQVLAHGNAAWFVKASQPYADPARVPRGLPVLSSYGYDGQFYYRLALDPANLHHTAFGITLDLPFRLQRIGYPLLTWLLSLGQRSWVPVMLVAVNVLALGAIGLLGGMFAREAGRHVLWGLLLAGYFGFVLSLGNDLTEPLAAACLLGGILAYRDRRPVLAGVLLAYGSLTRETIMVAAAAIALTRLIMLARRQARPGRTDLTWLLPAVAFTGWQLVVHAAAGTYPVDADASSNVARPVEAAFTAVRTNLGLLPHNIPADFWLLELAILAVLAIAAARSLRSTIAPVHERLAFLFFLTESALLSSSVWSGYADFRSLDELYLFAVVIILGSSFRRLEGMAALVAPATILIAIYRTLG